MLYEIITCTIVVGAVSSVFIAQSWRQYCNINRSREWCRKKALKINHEGHQVTCMYGHEDSTIAPKKIYIGGDSLVVGIDIDHKATLPYLVSQHLQTNVSVTTDAEIGLRVNGMLTRIRHMATLCNRTYDHVILIIGGNDMLHGTSYQQIHNEMLTTLTYALAMSPRVTWVLCGDFSCMPFFVFPYNLLAKKRYLAYKKIFYQIATHFSPDHVKIVDMEEFMIKDGYSKKINRYLGKDQLHLNELGYVEFARILSDAICEKN